MLEFLNAHALEIVAALLALSEVLALVPALKSNSVLQLVVNGLKGIKGLLSKKVQ